MRVPRRLRDTRRLAPVALPMFIAVVQRRGDHLTIRAHARPTVTTAAIGRKGRTYTVDYSSAFVSCEREARVFDLDLRNAPLVVAFHKGRVAQSQLARCIRGLRRSSTIRRCS